tara:strand:- start:172 stop:768 length:597 start_codon:yes stop_codon:yes gene_type:complete
MSTFKDYLTESAKSFDYKIKIAGQPKDIDATRLETALSKFEVAKMSAGKKTPIQSVPLDFPQCKNEHVTIFDVTTNYPATSREMHEYIADYMNISPAMIVVRKPGEPTEQYQDEMEATKKSEYRVKLQDIEYSEHAKIKPEDFHSQEANMSLLKELLKDREENKHPKEKANIQSNKEEGNSSPLTTPDNPHPDPVRRK